MEIKRPVYFPPYNFGKATFLKDESVFFSETTLHHFF